MDIKSNKLDFTKLMMYNGKQTVAEWQEFDGSGK